jgi:hypothetical protein
MAGVTPPKPTGASEPPFAPAASEASIELYWLPLGAGGWLVRLNGRIYEAIHALLERRRPVWGRDELGTGEMWNSNSVIAWLLARSGLPTDAIRPPAGGRAPGWEAGLVTARRQPRSNERAGYDAVASPRRGRAG